MSTTRSAAQLVNAGVPKGHFTHIIVDEAAQLMEAEARPPPPPTLSNPTANPNPDPDPDPNLKPNSPLP